MKSEYKTGVLARKTSLLPEAPTGWPVLSRVEFLKGWLDEEERMRNNANRERLGIPLLEDLT